MVSVEYRKADCGEFPDLHIYTSSDVPGVYAAHEDLLTAYKDIGPQMEILMRENYGIECTAYPVEDHINSFILVPV